MSRYELSKEALEDLSTIWFDGAKRWGINQADNYALKIDEMCDFLIENRGLGRDKSDVIAGLKSYPIGSHTLYYVEQGDSIVIIRILHQRMDYELHLLN